MKFKILLFVLLAAIISVSFKTISNDKSQLERYSTVKVYINSTDDFRILALNDIEFDHYLGNIREGITLVINQEELLRLKQSGLRYEVTIPDMDEYYNNRLPSTKTELANSERVMKADNVKEFTYGSMGGFYTYAEMVQKLDSMRLLHPNLISAKQDRGTTTEGRKIWSVKISDNPDVDESATEPVIYFDGLHHAREPQGMATLFYYMNWLLDNYGTNPEATYIVNNREIYFIPVVNPDGYYYNQTTNPNGGGDWRKNRRNNGGSYGVDLNRNYSYMWGYDNLGSSNVPSSDTYRGPSAASEPEVQAVQNLANLVHPKLGISMHSVAGKTLNPYGYKDTVATYNIYSEFASNFGSGTEYLYGTVYQMLAYFSNGTTRDYMHSIGTYCWVIECGGSDFWPTQSEIIPIASDLMRSLKYVTYAGGEMVDMQNFNITGKGYAEKNDTLQLKVGIRNKGLSRTAKNVTVTLTTAYPNAVSLVNTVSYDSILSRQVKYNTTNPFKFILSNNAAYMDEILFVASVKMEGVETDRDTIRVNVGKTTTLFFDDAESGTSNWTKTGNQTMWDTSFCDSWSGIKSFADSRYGNSKDNTNNQFTLNNPVNLTGTVNPRVEFAAKWAMEKTGSTYYDYARLQISTDNGSTWTSLSGRYTVTASGQPSYSGARRWVYESINLNAYVNKTVKFRFTMYTDNGTPGDGFYFDDFKIVNFTNTYTGITNTSGEVPSVYSLSNNYPNPFNPSTNIKFGIPKDGYVTMKVFDIAGREISNIISGQMKAGQYEVNFNAESLSSGVYFYRMTVNNFTETKSMIILK
jgi:carboxypeptidase T